MFEDSCPHTFRKSQILAQNLFKVNQFESFPYQTQILKTRYVQISWLLRSQLIRTHTVSTLLVTTCFKSIGEEFWERVGLAGLGMWSVLVVQSEQQVIYRLMAGEGQGRPSLHGRNWRKETEMSGSSRQLILKKGAPGDQVWDLLCVQLASYLKRGPLIWMMPLHLHVN